MGARCYTRAGGLPKAGPVQRTTRPLPRLPQLRQGPRPTEEGARAPAHPGAAMGGAGPAGVAGFGPVRGRDLDEIPHPPMVVSMDRLAERARNRPGSIRFIHLNHTNPALHEPEIRAAIARRGFAVAIEGESLRF